VFAVVEDEERTPFEEIVRQRSQRIGGPFGPCQRHLAQHGLRGTRLHLLGPPVGELDGENAVGEPIGHGRRGLVGKPRLAGPAGGDERDEPVARHDVLETGELLGSADEARPVPRDAGRRRTKRVQRRELRAETVDQHLPDGDRLGDVGEAEGSELTSRYAVGQLGQAVLKVGGHDDLAPVGGLHEPRRTIEGRTEIVVVAFEGGTDVDPHAHLGVETLRPLTADELALDVHGRAQRAARRMEGSPKCIAGRREDGAAGFGDGVAKDAVVTEKHLVHPLRRPLPRARAALEVGEQERHPARRPLPPSGRLRHWREVTQSQQ
jgi:hypothetical protein